MEEIWKDVPGYEGLYQVSNFGKVIALSKEFLVGKGTVIVHKQKEISFHHKRRYFQVALNNKGKRKYVSVHRLVAQAFIPNPDNKPCIDHIDGNRANNRVDNLRWVTHKENSNNPITRERIKANCTGAKRCGANSPVAKRIKRISKDGKIKIYDTITEAKKDGFCYSSIIMCLKGRMNTHRKYKWEYYDSDRDNLQRD